MAVVVQCNAVDFAVFIADATNRICAYAYAIVAFAATIPLDVQQMFLSYIRSAVAVLDSFSNKNTRDNSCIAVRSSSSNTVSFYFHFKMYVIAVAVAVVVAVPLDLLHNC